MKLQMRFEGGAEIADALRKLSEAAGKRVSTEALKFGAEPIRSTAARMAPRQSPKPDIADNIVIATQRAKDEETAAVSVGPAEGFAYGLPQEVGTAFHPAQPFLRPAFDSRMQAALDRIRQEYWRALAALGISRSASVSASPSEGAFQSGGAGLGAGNRQAKPRGSR